MDKKAKIALAAFLLAWVVVLLVVSRVHRTSMPTAATPLIDLPVYPAAEELERRSQETGGGEWRSVQYEVESGCPSSGIYRLYERELGEAGWRLLGEGAPRWTGRSGKNGEGAMLVAAWVDKEELYRIDLQVRCLSGHRMKVNCNMMRNPLPEGPRPQPESPAGK